MPMPTGFVPTTGFPPGYEPQTLDGRPVVRVGCAGDAIRGVAAWTSYEQPQLSAEAIALLEMDRGLFGDCYLAVEDGSHVSPGNVTVLSIRGRGPRFPELADPGVARFDRAPREVEGGG